MRAPAYHLQIEVKVLQKGPLVFHIHKQTLSIKTWDIRMTTTSYNKNEPRIPHVIVVNSRFFIKS